MKRLLPILMFGLALAASARADTPPPPIREFDLKTIERLGREIYLQDRAAWLATDALTAAHPDFARLGLVGWVVSEGDRRVRFVRNGDKGLEAAFDIDVPDSGAPTVTEPADRTLTAYEATSFAAHVTASRAVDKVCRPGYNFAVARDPEGDGWLVWMLAPMPKAGDIPVGGHYRFTVSADGKTVRQADRLSNSCLVLPRPASQRNGEAIATVSHFVSPTPVETHVFLQIQSHAPMIVVTGKDTAWIIENGQIRKARL